MVHDCSMRIVIVGSVPAGTSVCARVRRERPRFTLSPVVRRVLAEYLGAMILVAAVVGSGIMATNLTDDVGVQAC